LYVDPRGSSDGFVKPVMRARWYGSSRSTPMAGAIQSTTVAASTAPASKTARCSQRVPAMKRVASRTAAYTTAVPTSGWRKTRNIGTAARPAAVSTVRPSESRLARSAR
jgi:hypothetical protein